LKAWEISVCVGCVDFQRALLIESQSITKYRHLEGRQVTHQAGVPKTACSKINNSIWALGLKPSTKLSGNRVYSKIYRVAKNVKSFHIPKAVDL